MKVIYLSKKRRIKMVCIAVWMIVCIIVAMFMLLKCKNNLTESETNNNEEAISTSVSLEEKIKESNKENKKIAYLTFDDGPTKKETAKILDILKEENIKATFFVVGKHVKEYPELVKREYDEGHYIANHGYSHNNKKLYQSQESFKNEIKNTDVEIAKALNMEEYCSHIFRFPNGYKTKKYKYQKKEDVKILEELGYYYIDWNCLNKDSEVKTSNVELMRNLKNTSKDKSTLIVLMHDTGDVNNTSEILKQSIEYLKQQGFEFRNMQGLGDGP